MFGSRRKTVEKLELPMMNRRTSDTNESHTAFTVSIEAKEGVTTGISAADRAQTIRVACDDNTQPEDLVVPGHIFPLKAKPGGVLTRTGHTEGSIDIARLAGKKPAAVICEIMQEDGTMARADSLAKFCKKFDLAHVSIKDIIAYRNLKESLVEKVKTKNIIYKNSAFQVQWFRSQVDASTHMVFLKGSPFSSTETIDVRVHKQNSISDTFPFLHTKENATNSNPISYALDMLDQAKNAAFVYLQNNDSWIDASNQKMDHRLYGIGAQILKAVGIYKMRLHVSQQRPLIGLKGFGLEVTETILMNPSKVKESSREQNI